MTWIDDITPAYATVVGQYVQVRHDGADENLSPDVQPLNGTGVLTATVTAGRIQDALAEVAPVPIRIFGGQIVDDTDNPGVRILSTDEDIGVEDWAWRATIRLDSGLQLKPVHFKAPAGETVNLTAGVVPVASAPYQIVNTGPGSGGGGGAPLWVGTQAEYDALTPDPGTVYVISSGDGGTTPPEVVQALGTVALTSPAVTSGSSIVPTLPTLGSHWGYLAIIVGQNTVSGMPWVAPAGWTRIADQSDTDGGFSARPMGIFKAPAGTATAAFASPAGGTQRYAAMVFPVRLEPVSRGFTDAPGASGDTATAPAMTYSSNAIPITIATSNHSAATGTALPSLSPAQYEVGSGPAVVSGSGSVTMLHVHVDGGPVMATAARTYTLSPAMGSPMSAWRFGLGS